MRLTDSQIEALDNQVFGQDGAKDIAPEDYTWHLVASELVMVYKRNRRLIERRIETTKELQDIEKQLNENRIKEGHIHALFEQLQAEREARKNAEQSGK